MQEWLKKVQVISLVGSADRRTAFAQNNPELDFTFRDAVDGRALVASGWLDPAIFAADLRYTPGAYGIAATTHQLWTEIAAGDRITTIAEDDAIFRPDFHAMAADLARQATGGFDLIVWAYNFDSVVRVAMFDGRVPCKMSFNQDILRASLREFRADRSPVLLLRLLESFGLCAYSISPAGARQLLGLCFPLKDEDAHSPGLLRPVPNLGIDLAMIRHYPGLRCFMAYPPLAVSPNVFETSTVQCF